MIAIANVKIDKAHVTKDIEHVTIAIVDAMI